MGSSKDFTIRILHFIGGFIFTIAGIILVIFEFSGNKGSDLSFIPWLILVVGLGWLGAAFDKHRKAQKQYQDISPSVQQESPPPLQHETLPPPLIDEEQPPALT